MKRESEVEARVLAELDTFLVETRPTSRFPRRERRLALAAACVLLVSFLLASSLPAGAVTCLTVTPSDAKFGTPITAAVVATAGTVSGTIDATGCDAGVYVGVTGVTITATVHDANQVGVFVDNGGGATVTGSTVSNTGNHVGSTFAPNGVQTGIGIYVALGASTTMLAGNTIKKYQKGGIVVRDPTLVTVMNNNVVGLGPFPLIAQNGIEIGFSSAGGTLSSTNVGHITGNFVTGNIYTQMAQKGVVSTGILAQAVPGATIGPLQSALQTSNTVFANQADVTVIPG